MATYTKKSNKLVKDPFKVKKSSAKKGLDVVEAPKELKSIIDEWKEFADLEKKYKAKKAGLAPQIKEFASMVNAKRRLSGKNENFNLIGDEQTCQFQMTSRISGGSDDDIALIVEKYGEEVAEALFQKDYASLKINDKYLKANWNEIIPKLTKALGDHFHELFSEMSHKLADDGLEKAAEFVETPEELSNLYDDLKVVSFLK